MSTPKYPDWVVSGGAPGDLGHCKRCGEVLRCGGSTLKTAALAAKEFSKVHAECKAPEMKT